MTTLPHLDDILEHAKKCQKDDLKVYVKMLVAELALAREKLEYRAEFERKVPAYENVVKAAQAYKKPHYGGLIGSTNYTDQIRITVALNILDALK